MKFNQFFSKYIKSYKDLDYIFEKKKGFIVWRRGTGQNVEILHLRVFELRKGYATCLFKRMLKELEKNPPYYSIFVFILGSNEPAKFAYKSWGFNLKETGDIYRDDKTIIGWQSYEKLKENEKIK